MPDAKAPPVNRYLALMEEIFHARHKKGAREVLFERRDLEHAAPVDADAPRAGRRRRLRRRSPRPSCAGRGKSPP